MFWERSCRGKTTAPVAIASTIKNQRSGAELLRAGPEGVVAIRRLRTSAGPKFNSGNATNAESPSQCVVDPSDPMRYQGRRSAFAALGAGMAATHLSVPNPSRDRRPEILPLFRSHTSQSCEVRRCQEHGDKTPVAEEKRTLFTFEPVRRIDRIVAPPLLRSNSEHRPSRVPVARVSPSGEMQTEPTAE